MKNRITAAMQVWNLVKGIPTDQIKIEMAYPARLALLGSEANVDALLLRLDRERAQGSPRAYDGCDIASFVTRLSDGQTAPANEPVLNADLVAGAETELIYVLARILSDRPELSYALAGRFGAFRPLVIARLISEYSSLNAKLAGLTALPGILPYGDWLLLFTAAGDLVALTRNQMELFLKIAACYSLPPDMRQRVAEFTIVVGGAFLWRAAARQVLGLVPAGIGVAVKAAVAYGGTYAIGRAAVAYYSSGGHRATAADVRQYFKEGLKAHRPNLW